jgi:Na+/H+-translocating membrane pyrophosphatase
LTANAGSARMQEISGAVLVGARAYLNRQYRAIAVVGLVVLIVLGVTLGVPVAIGYLIGAVLSASAGYIGTEFRFGVWASVIGGIIITRQIAGPSAGDNTNKFLLTQAVGASVPWPSAARCLL